MKRITFLLQSQRSHVILLALPSATSYVHLKTRINEIHWRQGKSDTKRKRFRRIDSASLSNSTFNFVSRYQRWRDRALFNATMEKSKIHIQLFLLHRPLISHCDIVYVLLH